MNLTEMFTKMRSGEVSAHSELGTRDEAKQTKTFNIRLGKLRVKTNIKAHALVMKDVVIPFNPFTGEADDTYNAKTPFRPILLVSQTLSQIKAACANDSEMASRWDEILGGNIDWQSPVTMDDYFLFKAKDMIKPRITSYSTVSCDFSGIAGFGNFRTTYTVDPTQLDRDNNYLPGINPLWNQAAVFFFAMIKPELDDVTAMLEKQSASKEQIANQKRTIRSKSPVSFVTQTNLLPFIYLPVDEAPKQFDEKRPIDFEPCIRWIKLNQDKWSSAMDDAKTNNLYDEHMDFYDFTIKTPSSRETKSSGQVYTDDDGLELYQAMTVTNTDSRLSAWTGQSLIDGKPIKNEVLYAPVWEAAARYFEYSQGESFKEDGDTFEKLMAASSRFRPIDSIMDRFLKACNHVFMSRFAGTKYATEEIRMANADFFMAMSPDNALLLASADDEDITAASERQAASLSDILTAAREGGDDEDAVGDGGENLGDLPLETDGVVV